jgi:hypothetical protein
MLRQVAAFLILTLVVGSTAARAADWVAAPSTYTHDPRTAERVNQYTPIGPVYAFPDPHVQSGYRHVQSVIRAGDAADYLHVVEQWGQNPVRPYEEWQYPFRPYSVPYDLWGPPAYLGYPYSPYPFPYGYPPQSHNPYQFQQHQQHQPSHHGQQQYKHP